MGSKLERSLTSAVIHLWPWFPNRGFCLVLQKTQSLNGCSRLRLTVGALACHPTASIVKPQIAILSWFHFYPTADGAPRRRYEAK
jgi:hypothetical protein